MGVRERHSANLAHPPASSLRASSFRFSINHPDLFPMGTLDLAPVSEKWYIVVNDELTDWCHQPLGESTGRFLLCGTHIQDGECGLLRHRSGILVE